MHDFILEIQSALLLLTNVYLYNSDTQKVSIMY